MASHGRSGTTLAMKKLHHGRLSAVIVVGIVLLLRRTMDLSEKLETVFAVVDAAIRDHHVSSKHKDAQSQGTSRRHFLLGPLSMLTAACGEEAKAEAFNKEAYCEECCMVDWCACDHSICNCHAALKAAGYKVPLDAPGAYSAAGPKDWSSALAWQSSDIPRWKPTRTADVEVRNSSLPGAGQGLFTRVALPKGAVLPPYSGNLLTFSDVARRRFSPDMEYTWCPQMNGMLISASSQEELFQNPPAKAMAYCVDGKPTDGQSRPTSFVNGAGSKEQCGAVNVKMCELGQVMYFRTTQPVPAGTELVTNYGSRYWEFEGCNVPAW